MAERRGLEKRLGVAFKNRAILEEALRHSSYVNENPDTVSASNERLEFLGDAVLGLIVAHELFKAHPGEDEGTLTELRTHLVRRDTLARAAERLHLGQALHLGRGEEAGGGRERPTNLANAYEAVVGAVFLDRGLATARRFVRHSLQDDFKLAQERTQSMDPKSRLQALSQARYQLTPLYRLIDAQGPEHARRFTVEAVIDGDAVGRGKGRSKQQAEKDAARQALERLERST